MANSKRFHHHHGQAAIAMKKGDVKAARAHVGHMLQALRDHAPQGMPAPEPDADQQGGPGDMDADDQQPQQGNPMVALRARLGAMGGGQ